MIFIFLILLVWAFGFIMLKSGFYKKYQSNIPAFKELLGKEMPRDLKPWQFLIQYAADAKKILLLDNFFIGMNINDIEKFIDEVKKREILALYIGEDYFQSINLDDNLIFCTDDMSIPGISEKVKALKNKK